MNNMIIDARKALNDIFWAEEGIRQFNFAFEKAALNAEGTEEYLQQAGKAAASALAKLEESRTKSEIFLQAEIEIEEALKLL